MWFVVCIILLIVVLAFSFAGKQHTASKGNESYVLNPLRGGETILFVDTETTGLPKDYKASYKDSENWPRLVQISWILTDAKGTILEATDYIIRPEHFTIPQEATNIHGITNRMAKEEGYKLRKVLLHFLEMLDKCDFIVGHNIDFDVNVIAAELHRKELPTSSFIIKPRACTMKAGTDFCAIPKGNGYKWPKLSELYYHIFSETFENAHNAQSDVYATMQCYFGLLDIMYSSSVSEYKVDMITDKLEPITTYVSAGDIEEAKQIAIGMLERGELECVGQICTSCSAAEVQ